MADGQTQEVPEASVESRLATLFSEPAEAPAEETAEVEAQTEETTESTEETQQAEETVDLAEITDDDGQTYQVPPKLKDSFLRWKDYSQKTAQIAELAKSAEDKLQFAQAREQAFAAVMTDVAEFKALQAQRQQYDQVDWGALYNADLGQAVKLRDQRDMLDKQLAEKAQAIQGKANQVQQMQQQHHGNQWNLAVQGAKQVLGAYSESDDKAAAQWVQTRHFTDSELKGRFADARVLEAFHKAARWDSLQAGKPGSVAKAQAAPPVIRPGASKGAGAASESKYKDARAALKKSGDLKDAARLFMLRG